MLETKSVMSLERNFKIFCPFVRAADMTPQELWEENLKPMSIVFAANHNYGYIDLGPL